MTPNPPRNVAFAFIAPTRSQDVVLQARWAVHECDRDITCVEALGYVARCIDGSRNEIKRTILLSDVSDSLVGGIALANLSVMPYTDYDCSMATLNGNGLGFFGSVVSVTGIETG